MRYSEDSTMQSGTKNTFKEGSNDGFTPVRGISKHGAKKTFRLELGIYFVDIFIGPPMVKKCSQSLTKETFFSKYFSWVTFDKGCRNYSLSLKVSLVGNDAVKPNFVVIFVTVIFLNFY